MNLVNLEIWQAGLAAGVGGVLFTLAFAFNSRLHRSIHSPLAASAMSFTISFLFVGSLVGLWGQWNIIPLGQAPWWSFLGGATGSCSIILSLLALPRIGLVALGIAIVFGQLGFSLLIEQLGFTTRSSPSARHALPAVFAADRAVGLYHPGEWSARGKRGAGIGLDPGGRSADPVATRSLSPFGGSTRTHFRS